jgi:hypothetical protein
MNAIDFAPTRLRRGAMLRIRDGEGRSIAVFGGLVWITQEGDPRDVFIAGGETFTIDRPGLVLVDAMDDTDLIVLAPGASLARDPRVAHADARELPLAA